MLLIAYRKATIGLADEVLFLDSGRIVDRGTHQQLLARNPAYATLVNAYEAEPVADRDPDRPRHRPYRLRRGERMSADTAPADELAGLGTSVDSGDEISAINTIRRGLAFSPELAQGYRWTLLLALIGTAGRVVVPVAVQQTLDRGINGPSGVDLGFVARWRHSRLSRS